MYIAKESLRHAIVTLRKPEAKGVFYEFHLATGSFPQKGGSAMGGKIVSVRNLPKMYSELPDALHSENENGWKPIGEIFYKLEGSKARISKYFPKKFVGKGVKRLGYYLNSISTHDVVNEFKVARILSSNIFNPSSTDGRPPYFVAHHERVDINVDNLRGMDEPAKRYLRAMGKGVKGKQDER